MSDREHFAGGPAPEDLIAMSEGAKWGALLPHMEAEVAKLTAEVQTRVFAAIARGDLTDEAAKLAWLEVYSHHKMLKRFNTRVRVGESVGEKYAHVMQIEGDRNG